MKCYECAERVKIQMPWEFVSYVGEEFAKSTLSVRRPLPGRQLSY